jgi:hypothetical protein
MNKMSNTITVIRLPIKSVEVAVDRLGGETHGVVASAVNRIAGNIPADAFAAKFTEIIENVRTIAENLKTSVGGYEAEEITIGLAVTAEGNIGIATAGVEASIEVYLRRK